MSLKINEIKKTLSNIYKLSEDGKYIAVMLWGPAGVGKSSAVKQVCDELGIGMIDLRLSLLNPVDLRGLPYVNKEHHKAEWLEPDFLPNGKDALKGVLFLDEINLAPQSVMSAGYQLILDRKLGDYKLPAGWVVIAAGNRTEDSGIVTKFPAPLANRFIHLEIGKPDVEEWRSWAMKEGVHQQIIAFLSKMPQHLYKPPINNEKAWASPRSWAVASNLHGIGEKIDSAVGGGIASEFYAFLSVYDKLPDIDAILRGEDIEAPSGTALDVNYAISIALAVKCEPKQVENYFKYIVKLKKEFQALSIFCLQDRGPAIQKAISVADGWDKWVKNNKALTSLNA